MSKSEDSIRSSNSIINKKVRTFDIYSADMKDVRIIQNNLVYVIGLSSTLANKETLYKQEYFGQYGSITKVVVNKNKAYNPTRANGPSYSAYISYSTAKDAALAILSIDNIEADEHTIRASFGTTKYCTNFLKNLDCPNKDCLYVHNEADESEIIYKQDKSGNKNIFYEQQILAMRLADIFNEDIRKNLLLPKQYKSIFPSTEKIYDKQIVIENDPVLKYTSKRYSLEENCNNPKNKNLYRDNNTKIKKQYADDYNSYYNGYQNYENEYNNNYNCEDNDCEYEYVLVRENKKSLYNHKKKTIYKLHTSNKKEKFSYTKKKSNGLTVNTLNSPNKLEGDSNKEISNNHILNKEMPNENKSEPQKIYDDYENKSGDNSTSSNTDDCKIKINLDITNSPESVCSLKNNANNINIYRKRENSRFGFVNKIERNNSDNVCNIIEIPDYVSDILYKKISSYTFFKKFTCVNDVTKDIMNFEKVLNKYKNDSWVQFIKSNVSIVKKC